MLLLPVVIIGAGGHAKVLIDALWPSEILGLTDASPDKWGQSVLGMPVLGNDGVIGQYAPATVALVNGLGSVRPGLLRARIFDDFSALGYHFPRVLHRSACVGPDVELSEGVQVMAGAVLQPGCRVGKNSIINTAAVIDHDCLIGSHCHIAPGVTLSGGVIVGEHAHVGTGATVIQNVHIGAGSLVAAGSVVIGDVAPGMRVAGVPAREINL